MRGDGVDQLYWWPAKYQGFEVGGYYHSLSSSNGMLENCVKIEGSS